MRLQGNVRWPFPTVSTFLTPPSVTSVRLDIIKLSIHSASHARLFIVWPATPKVLMRLAVFALNARMDISSLIRFVKNALHHVKHAIWTRPASLVHPRLYFSLAPASPVPQAATLATTLSFWEESAASSVSKATLSSQKVTFRAASPAPTTTAWSASQISSPKYQQIRKQHAKSVQYSPPSAKDNASNVLQIAWPAKTTVIQ